MGWIPTFLLGDIGKGLDLGGNEIAITALRKNRRRKAHVERAQDTAIERLSEAVDQLKLGLASTSRLLLSQGVLSPDDLRRFIGLIDEPSPDEATAGQSSKAREALRRGV